MITHRHLARRRVGRAVAVVAIVAGALAPSMAQAQLSTMNYQYFKVQNNHAVNPDFENGIDGGIVTGLVNSTLTGSAPSVTAKAISGAGFSSGPISQYDPVTHQLLWWTDNGSTILADGTGTVSVPFSGMANNFFPTGESSNANWFRTAIFTGMINVSDPTNYSFSLGSDDDSWLFIDGQLVGDDGGVKANDPTVFNTGTLAPGSHSVALYFADRNTVQSGITFSPQFSVVATPEPGTLSLVATGVVGLVGVVRRKRMF